MHIESCFRGRKISEPIVSILKTSKPLYCCAHVAIRRVLETYLQIKPPDVAFSYQVHGKPEWRPVIRPRESSSISHSEELALLALTLNSRIGIDRQG